MADEINRQSLKTNLEQRYKAGPVNTGGGDAKKAGAPDLSSTHFVSEKDLDFQTNAKTKPSNIEYHWNKAGGTDRIKNVPYAPSGRL